MSEKKIEVTIEPSRYPKPNLDAIKQNLNLLSYQVTQEAATERPFSHPYYKEEGKGLYVDIVTKEPIFLSTDKFDAGCGWPSFSRPISEEVVNNIKDRTHGMIRIEVRSRSGDSHLGHVFNDGPKSLGGLRYCINGASLEFIPYEKMSEKGYDYLLELFE